jgi:hypothetical protein
MPVINILESISQLEKKITFMEGSLKVYKELLENGVKTISVPEIIKVET